MSIYICLAGSNICQCGKLRLHRCIDAKLFQVVRSHIHVPGPQHHVSKLNFARWQFNLNIWTPSPPPPIFLPPCTHAHIHDHDHAYAHKHAHHVHVHVHVYGHGHGHIYIHSHGYGHRSLLPCRGLISKWISLSSFFFTCWMLTGTWDDNDDVLARSLHAHVCACWIPTCLCPCPLDPHMHSLTHRVCMHAYTGPMHGCLHQVPTPAHSQGPPPCLVSMHAYTGSGSPFLLACRAHLAR